MINQLAFALTCAALFPIATGYADFEAADFLPEEVHADPRITTEHREQHAAFVATASTSLALSANNLAAAANALAESIRYHQNVDDSAIAMMATVLSLAAASVSGSARSLQIALDDPRAVGTSYELAATSLATAGTTVAMAAVALSTTVTQPSVEEQFALTSSSTLGMAATSLAMAAASLGKVLEDPAVVAALPEIVEAYPVKPVQTRDD